MRDWYVFNLLKHVASLGILSVGTDEMDT